MFLSKRQLKFYHFTSFFFSWGWNDRFMGTRLAASHKVFLPPALPPRVARAGGSGRVTRELSPP